jgi:pimeloyl-ACP methyl ester carboxylesterase
LPYCLDPIHVEIIHTIIGYARRNQLVIPNPRSFMTILLCGHSLGSVISNVLNTKYPSDADAMLLTGFAPILPTNEIGLAAQALLFPADISAPQYAKLSPAYLIFDSRTDFDFLFYYPPETDINMQNRDWATRGTFALGEAATAALPSQVARDYANPVLVVTGSHDSFFCSLLSLDIQFLLGSPNCDTTATGPAASTASLYPNAKSFTYLTPNAGHCWQLHTNAYATFVQVHEWIRSQGF